MKNEHFLLLIIFSSILFALVLRRNFSDRVAQHFSIMAESFIHGRLDLMRLDPITGSLDIFFYKGQAHWANFPFPGVILIPFVFVFERLGLFFYQGYLQFFLSLGVFGTSYLLARRFKFSELDSLYLAIAACFGSNYSFVAFYSGSWFYSQPVVVLLLLLALWEWYTKRRYFLVGIYLGCLLATRVTAGFASAFFLLGVLLEKRVQVREKAVRLCLISLPIAISVALLLTYNYARFGSIWETGYTDDNISPEYQVTMLKKHGILRLENIPTNLYWNFLALPEPVLEEGTYHLTSPFFRVNPWGMSFFVMSPIFLLIFKSLNKPTLQQTQLWLGSFAVLIPLLLWYSTGFWQVGARYILDLFPLWFVLLLTVFKKPVLSLGWRVVILLSSLTNLFWVLPLPRLA